MFCGLTVPSAIKYVRNVDWFVISPNDGPEKTLNARYENSSPRYGVRTILLPLAFFENFSGFR